MRSTTALVAAVIVGLLVTPTSASAQASARVFRIGYIQTATPEEQAHLTKAFDEGLRELGYVEGRNIVIERRFAWGKQERLPGLAADLVRLNVDVIVTGGNPAAVRQATTTIPVVMAASRDPLVSGFVASLSKPGGNITGLTNDAYRKVVEDAARQLGVGVQAVAVRGRSEFEDAFAAMARERADAVVVLPDPVFFTARSQVVRLTTKYRLPAVYHAREFVELGGLMSYGASLTYQFRRAAAYVDKILEGAKPGELPVEQAAKLELIINLKTAKALGLSIPQSVIVRVDQVIE